MQQSVNLWVIGTPDFNLKAKHERAFQKLPASAHSNEECNSALVVEVGCQHKSGWFNHTRHAPEICSLQHP